MLWVYIGLYWVFGGVNFIDKKWKSLDLLKLMNSESSYTAIYTNAHNFLVSFIASPQEPQLYIPRPGFISLSSYVRNSFSCLKYIENFMV